MENTIRVIITIFFIGLIALAIIFFGVFGILPLMKIGNIAKKNSTSTEAVPYVLPSSGASSSQVVSPEGSTSTPSTVPQENPTQPIQQQDPTPPPPPAPRVVRLDVPAGSPDAPQQSNAISGDQVPQGALHIIIKDNGFSPSSFAIKTGKEITLYISSGDGRTHSINFTDPSVQGIAVGVGPNETRSITFKAPAVGTYSFSCTVPGHAGSGEEGMMVVE